MSENSNIHDKSYKDLFSNKETFLNLIQTFVNKTWGDNITKENLVLVDKSYVLSDYEELELDKEELYENQNISSAIFLLDQNIDRIEFYTRLKDIVLGFNKLKNEEKSQLKHWLINVNSNDNDYKNNVEKILNSDREVVIEMTSNISKGLEKLKQEGKFEGKIEILLELLTTKFKVLPEEYMRIIKTLPEESIKTIATNIFDIENIEELNKYFPK